MFMGVPAHGAPVVPTPLFFKMSILVSMYKPPGWVSPCTVTDLCNADTSYTATIN